VSIDASNSADPDGSIKSYLFDFGDGTDPVTIEVASVNHQYAVNGTYNATVIVTDERGASTLAYREVVIGETVTGGPPDDGSGLRPPTSPGSETPGVPGPAPVLLLAGVVGLALAMRRRRQA
jgi:MYXO-CTERM domain-containing protein